jgi:FkbM family methyltransferase
MYVRDTYLHNGDLAINDGDFVLDLGSNVGNFANLALAHGKSVKVIAVEPSRDLNKDWYRSISLNDGFSARSTLVSAFMGQMGELQNTIKETETYRDAAWLSEDDLISTCGLRKIDFLKCDIEGGEYGLLNKDSKILQMAQNIAIEIHQFAGNPGEFLEMLASQGFNIKNVQRAPDGTITALGSRNS